MNTNQSKVTQSKQRMNTKNLVITALFTAILCVLAQINIPTQPIPFTLSVFAIFFIGALLPPRYALMSVMAYVLLGAFGLPVFAGSKGGISVLTGMTGGFIMAYPFMALLTSMSHTYMKRWRTVALTTGMLLSLVICYAFGSFWFTVVTGKSFIYALTVCVYPYLLFDLLKITLAVSFSKIIKATVFKTYSNF